MTVTIAPASRNACAAPNPILGWSVSGITRGWCLSYPDVPPTTMIFLFTSLSADLVMVERGALAKSYFLMGIGVEEGFIYQFPLRLTCETYSSTAYLWHLKSQNHI